VRDTEFYDHIIDLGKIREGNFPVCTDVQRGAGFFNKIKIPLEKYSGTLNFAFKSFIYAKLVLEESAKAIPPHYLTKVRDAHISCQIKEPLEL
jgi:hypothetical protein